MSSRPLATSFSSCASSNWDLQVRRDMLLYVDSSPKMLRGAAFRHLYYLTLTFRVSPYGSFLLPSTVARLSAECELIGAFVGVDRLDLLIESERHAFLRQPGAESRC